MILELFFNYNINFCILVSGGTVAVATIFLPSVAVGDPVLPQL